MKKFSFLNILLCGGIFYTSCGEDVVVKSDSDKNENTSETEKEEEKVPDTNPGDVAIAAIGVDSIYQYEGGALLYKFVNEYNERGIITKQIGYNMINDQLVKSTTMEFAFDANDSILCESTINELQNTYWKKEYAYDTNGHKISTLIYDWTAGQWGDVYQQEEYNYDLKGNLVLTIGKYFSQNPWDQDYKISYTLDSSNNVTYEKKEKWDGYNWYTNYAYSYKLEYDSNKRIISKIVQPDFSARADYRVTYTYDDAANITSCIYAYPTNDGKWSDREKHVYTYNSKNKPLSWILYVSNGNGWNMTNKTVYTYDNDVYLKQQEYIYSSESGIRSGQIKYYYTILK